MDAVALDNRLSKPTIAFLSHHRKLLIGGKFVAAASGKTFSVYNPATGTAPRGRRPPCRPPRPAPSRTSWPA